MTNRARGERTSQDRQGLTSAVPKSAMRQQRNLTSNMRLGNHATANLISSQANDAAPEASVHQVVQRKKKDEPVRQLPEERITIDLTASDQFYVHLWGKVLNRAKANIRLDQQLKEKALKDFGSYAKKRIEEFKSPEWIADFVIVLAAGAVAFAALPSLPAVLAWVAATAGLGARISAVLGAAGAALIGEMLDEPISEFVKPATSKAPELQGETKGIIKAKQSEAYKLRQKVEQEIESRLQTIINTKRAHKSLSEEDELLEKELAFHIVNDRVLQSDIDEFLHQKLQIPTPAMAQTSADEVFRNTVKEIELSIIKFQGGPTMHEKGEWGLNPNNPKLGSDEQYAAYKADVALAKTKARKQAAKRQSSVVQRMSMSASRADALVDGEIEERILRERSSVVGLDSIVRKDFEHTLGTDFSGVRIHASTEASVLTEQLDASAFTIGEDIFFRTGAFNPHSQQGQFLLAHELVHVRQQQNGLKGDSPGLQVNVPGDRYEQEADTMASRVMADSTLSQAKDLNDAE